MVLNLIARFDHFLENERHFFNYYYKNYKRSVLLFSLKPYTIYIYILHKLR